VDGGPLEVSMDDGGDEPVMFPDVGAPPPIDASDDAPGTTTCDNSEKAAPPPP
jgi:hypothetical protein